MVTRISRQIIMKEDILVFIIEEWETNNILYGNWKGKLVMKIAKKCFLVGKGEEKKKEKGKEMEKRRRGKVRKEMEGKTKKKEEKSGKKEDEKH